MSLNAGAGYLDDAIWLHGWDDVQRMPCRAFLEGCMKASPGLLRPPAILMGAVSRECQALTRYPLNGPLPNRELPPAFS